ncbi:MlaD family protein [Mycolicibacterium sp. YH-1]|uniref:MlaD family protein n=1 Tax=Mycolicibacterium sp. YH-1 TaxID=2908837 RepID=UPI001F4C0CBD|nr:MlaD family protein [Mycolicibacterium sp. YH-1]UNB52172.1 MlaD family protein [Mycolicibacterium sp. YH-1]
MQQVNTVRRERLWGAALVAIVAIIGIVAGAIYVSPPDEKIVTFYTDDAASIRPGDTVRIAGIVVGDVKDLAIEPSQIRVRTSVKRDAFVGDQSQVQVRMLTVVGGYFVTIIPLGDAELGARPIPKERVTMPYSLVETLADTTKITDDVAPQPIKDSLDQLQQGLTGGNTDSVSAVLDAANSIVNTMDRQRGQISKILRMSDEYVQTLTDYRGQLQEYIRKIAILEGTLVLYGKSFADALQGIGAVVQAAKYGLLKMYFTNRKDFLDRMEGILTEFRTIQSRNGVMVRVLGRVHDRMERAIGNQNTYIRPELLATDICVPVHGSPC